MPQNDSIWHDHAQSTTRSIPSLRHRLDSTGVVGLTLLCHPDWRRVGEQAALSGLVSGQAAELSRLTPHFVQPTGGTPRPLADPHLSRRPLSIAALADGGVGIAGHEAGAAVKVDGQRLSQELSQGLELDSAALERGVVIELNHRIALLLHRLPPPQKRPPRFGLIGDSTGMLRLRHEIQRLAHLDYPVLLRGESGTGKELVAGALHSAGPRSERPFISVNIGAVPTSLAVAELFGTAKGAFTGAEQRRAGHFQRADGGTLFLDEIGDTPADVQVLLLRALETHQIQPLGAADSADVDVRLISATDIDLETAMELGELRSSLFHRLSGCELELPPVRERRDDIGRLFFHFLASELETVGVAMGAAASQTAAQGHAFPTIPASLVARLVSYPWPGNVRELRNFVRQLVVANWSAAELSLPDSLERRLLHSADASESSLPTAEPAPEGTYPASFRDPHDISETALLAALRDNRWNIRQTAKALGLARPSLYRRMRESPNVRKANDLSREELSNAMRDCSGRLDDMVDRLQVSKRGLQLRMSELGLSGKTEAE